MSKLVNAINFAAVAHRNQRRKDVHATPYINHPIEVMYFLSNAGVTDEDTLCAAVLHDAIEDVGVTYEQLVDNFGENVANIVRECTDNKALPKVVRKQQQIEHAKHISVSAKMIKAADKLSNISDLDTSPPTQWSTEEIDGYFTWCYAVWQQLAGYNDILDAKLLAIFEKKNLTKLTTEEFDKRLAAYYSKISN